MSRAWDESCDCANRCWRRGDKLGSILDGSCNCLVVCLSRTCALDENGTWACSGLRTGLDRTLRRLRTTGLGWRLHCRCRSSISGESFSSRRENIGQAVYLDEAKPFGSEPLGGLKFRGPRGALGGPLDAISRVCRIQLENWREQWDLGVCRRL